MGFVVKASSGDFVIVCDRKSITDYWWPTYSLKEFVLGLA